MMNKNELRLENIVSSLCSKPGLILEDILGLKVGKIKVGFNADFVSINPDYEIFIDEDFFVSKSSNSPLIGKKMKGKVNMTIFDGKIVYEFIKSIDSKNNIVFVTHYVVIGAILNIGTSSGEIVVTDKNLNIIGSIDTL